MFVIVQEVIHTMRKNKGKRRCPAVKLDLEKAFDRMSWKFVENVFGAVGLERNLITLIVFCISSNLTVYIWNGKILDSFQLGRSLKGDPLSSYFLLLCMELLGHYI